MTELYELTAADAAARIRARDLSPVELMESLLDRADRLEPGLKIWAALDPDAAIAAARQREREAEAGAPLGLLHGVPVGVKDIYYTQGVRTAAGSTVFADFVPAYDATAVALLKEQGAIVMGKTVTTEFACMDPPPTRNPWDPAHTPGGSSTGSAVGVATRVFPVALGSQTGGSVLRPASYNGVVGLKPTFGRISRHGVFPVAASLDTMGAFSRTVEDAALLLRVMAGRDGRDPASSPRPVQDYRYAVASWNRAPRVGLVSRFFFEEADPEVRTHTTQVVQRLGAAGAEVEEAALSFDFDGLLAAHHVIMSTEAADVHRDDFAARADDYGPNVRGLIEDGLGSGAVDYIQAKRTVREFRAALGEALRPFDALLTPTTATPAPRDLTTTGPAMFQSPWTASGFPTITLPSGLSESGLPLGVQIGAAPFDESTLLAVARWCEQALGVSLTPPGLG